MGIIAENFLHIPGIARSGRSGSLVRWLGGVVRQYRLATRIGQRDCGSLSREQIGSLRRSVPATLWNRHSALLVARCRHDEAGRNH